MQNVMLLIVFFFLFLSRILCDTAIVINYVAVACVYIVAIASSLQGVIFNQFHVDLNLRIYIAIIVAACLVMGQIRLLRYLIPCSIIANIAVITVIGIVLYYIFDFGQPIDFSHRRKFPSVGDLPSYFSIVVFAMECVGTMLPIANDMKHPEKFLSRFGVLNSGMFLVVSFYVVVGFFGYMRFGDAIKSSITLNLPIDDL